MPISTSLSSSGVLFFLLGMCCSVISSFLIRCSYFCVSGGLVTFPTWEKWRPVGSSGTFSSGCHSCMLQEYPCWVALVLLLRQAGYCGWSSGHCWALGPLIIKSCLLADGWGEAQGLLRLLSPYWCVGPPPVQVTMMKL